MEEVSSSADDPLHRRDWLCMTVPPRWRDAQFNDTGEGNNGNRAV
jgi:hypothetical protein